ncbi:MAG: glycosyltransferase [Phycisphaerales bacterium]|nr:glycosyltransferase [Phycisphaerales bacterium]
MLTPKCGIRLRTCHGRQVIDLATELTMNADRAKDAPPRIRPRVAVIYHFFAHYREAIVERLARSQVADFTFFGDDHDFESSIKRAHFSSRVRFHLQRTRKLISHIMWQHGVIGLSLSRQYDTIIFLGVVYWPATWIGAILARLTGKRVFFWGHGFLYPPVGLKGLLRRAFHCLPHAHLFYGRMARQHALDLGWSPSRIHVIGNSLDLDSQTRERESITAKELADLRTRLFANPELPIAFCTSRLTAKRKLDMLIKALALLKREGVNANLLIVGDGETRAELEGMANNAGIAAHFVGACYDEAQLARYIMASRVTVSPGFVGLTAMHSMAFGVPVVTHGNVQTQMPEFEAVIPGVTGDFFKENDVDDLARALKPWLLGERPLEQTRKACIALIESAWSPEFQGRAIEWAVMGNPAHDLAVVPPKMDA